MTLSKHKCNISSMPYIHCIHLRSDFINIEIRIWKCVVGITEAEEDNIPDTYIFILPAGLFPFRASEKSSKLLCDCMFSDDAIKLLLQYFYSYICCSPIAMNSHTFIERQPWNDKYTYSWVHISSFYSCISG